MSQKNVKLHGNNRLIPDELRSEVENLDTSKPFWFGRSLQERLAAALAQSDMDIFVQKTGRSARQLKRYVEGGEVTVEVLKAIAEVADVPPSWILEGTPSLTSKNIEGWLETARNKPYHSATLSIPRYAIDAAAGDGAIALSQDVEDFFMVSRDWISRFAPSGARLGVIQARGDSMEPTINNADALIVCFDITKQNINEGGVFVFSDSHGIKVKRIQMLLDGRLRISSDNERYEPEYVDQEYADEHLTIHAKVLLKTGPL